MSTVTQSVDSIGADGQPRKVRFGVDPDRGFFVQTPEDAQPRFFDSLYSDSIQQAVNEANAIRDPEQRLRALVDVFKTDPASSYAKWWAEQFRF
jgi:hypothetical protein